MNGDHLFRISLNDRLSTYFKWHEVLWLPKWGIHCFPTDEVRENLIQFFHEKIDPIRSYIDKPFIVVSGYRPRAYNDFIKGATLSQHCLGRAVDVRVEGMTGDALRMALRPVLERFKVRVEDLPGASWVHIDNGVVGPSGRFFKP